MNRKAILLPSTLILALAAIGCGTASAPESNTAVNSNANANANTAVVATNPANNPIANVTPAPVGESKIPGIPDMPGTDQPVAKNDPTRTAKAQVPSRPAPDNSVIEGPILGENIVETRIFKNNAQIAKIEKIQDTKTQKTTVKVYLKNGKVSELPEGKVGDPLAETAANIMTALGGGAPQQAKPETKAPPAADTDGGQKKP